MQKNFKLLMAAALMVLAMCQSRGALLTWNTSPGTLIPDYPSDGLASLITIGSGDSQLTGIVNPSVAYVASVQFTIAGGWAGDFTVMLKYTDGAGISRSATLLSSLLSGNAANGGFSGVTLSSASGTDTAIPSGTDPSPITGTFYGVNFSTFQNLSPVGDWIFYVTDNANGSQGTLSGWTLNLEVVPEPVNVVLVVFGAFAGIVALTRSNAGKRFWSPKMKS